MFQHVRIPPVIGMIILGCIARNFFGDVVKPFPRVWAQWIRMCVLGTILTRGGLQFSFKGKGLLVIMLSLIPSFFEATAHALIGMGIFDMPIEVSYSMGFACSSVGTAIVAA